ncbi:MAG: transposase, partial [Jiangellaceae bacterium]
MGLSDAPGILADVGDFARFTDRNHFASWTGTAPIDASRGEQIWHRLSRAVGRIRWSRTATTAATSSSHEHPTRRHCFRRGPHSHRRRHWRSRSAQQTSG